MRILMLNNEYPPLGGGTATVNEELLKCFAEHGEHTIDLITSSATGQDETISITPLISIHRLKVGSACLHHASNGDLIRYAWRSFHYGRHLIRRNKYDLIFAFSALPAGAIALALSKFYQIPYLVRVCGPDIPGFEERYRTVYFFLTPLIKSVWKHSKFLVAKCAEEADLIKKTLPKAQVHIIPNGVDLTAFPPAPDRKERSPDEPLRLLCVGRLIKRKGQSDLFKAMRKAIDQGANLHLTLVGDGDEYENYVTEVSQLNLMDRVRFAGYVPRDEIGTYYQSADIFVLPSYNEGMSVSLLEAMASGLAIVASKEASAGITLGSLNRQYLFSAGSVEEMSLKLLAISRNTNALPQLRTESVQISHHWEWDRTISHYIKLLIL